MAVEICNLKLSSSWKRIKTQTFIWVRWTLGLPWISCFKSSRFEMDGWMHGCMDGWMHGWMDACLKYQIFWALGRTTGHRIVSCLWPSRGVSILSLPRSSSRGPWSCSGSLCSALVGDQTPQDVEPPALPVSTRHSLCWPGPSGLSQT